MQDFYREIDENININRTFSIDDIIEQDKLTRFFIIGEDVSIGNILEDLEFLPPHLVSTVAVADVSVESEDINNSNENTINHIPEEESMDNKIETDKK